jgi:hypothetical protein
MTKKLAYSLHAFAVLAALIFCANEAYSAFLYFGEEFIGRSVARITIVALCGSFALSHALLVLNKQFSLLSSLSFSPLFILLGGMLAMVVQSHYKHWAPATAEEACIQSVVGFCLISVICITCIYTILKASKEGAKGA